PAPTVPGPAQAPDEPAPGSGTRGRRQSPLWRIGGTLDVRVRLILGAVGVGLLLAVWALAAAAIDDPAVFPTPLSTMQALGDLWSSGRLWTDLWAASQRIRVGYG